MNTLTNCKKLLIEVNQTCNLNCTYCFYRDYGRQKSELTTDNIKEMLNICPNANEFFLTGGECFTSKNIDSIIELLSSKGYLTIFTNGVRLNKYNDNHLKEIVNKVDRFIISLDHYNNDNYKCRLKLNETIEVIKRIIAIDSKRLEVKICISNYNKNDFKNIIDYLISLGVKYLSVNLIFDIKNSDLKHEVKEQKDLIDLFKIIKKYKKYFNKSYIDTLEELYLNNKPLDKYPCLADNEYYYLDCNNKYYICPGNCQKLNKRGDWKKCYTKECANEWEIMYRR